MIKDVILPTVQRASLKIHYVYQVLEHNDLIKTNEYKPLFGKNSLFTCFVTYKLCTLKSSNNNQ